MRWRLRVRTFQERRNLRHVLLMATMAASASAQAATDLPGKALFDQKCGACHQVGLGARDDRGPQLNGLIGKPAGNDPAFSYSPALRKSAVIRDKPQFDAFIADPKAKMPGTRMAIPGVTSKDERDAIYAYVARFRGDGRLK